MKTITARAVNELYRRHLFQLAITFHGGMRVSTHIKVVFVLQYNH